jgi:hypothetical protein
MLEDLLKGVPVTVGELHGRGWNASGAELEAERSASAPVLAVYEGQSLAGRAEQAGVASASEKSEAGRDRRI